MIQRFARQRGIAAMGMAGLWPRRPAGWQKPSFYKRRAT
jgi:hypothetical protein